MQKIFEQTYFRILFIKKKLLFIFTFHLSYRLTSIDDYLILLEKNVYNNSFSN